MENLQPILYDDKFTAFNLRDDDDIFETKVILHDYDWMQYNLMITLPTKAYGDMTIDFKYFGATHSQMTVKTSKGKTKFNFDSRLFEKHITKFLQKHIKHWKGTKAFFGIKEAVEFYNEVITDKNTKRIGKH